MKEKNFRDKSKHLRVDIEENEYLILNDLKKRFNLSANNILRISFLNFCHSLGYNVPFFDITKVNPFSNFRGVVKSSLTKEDIQSNDETNLEELSDKIGSIQMQIKTLTEILTENITEKK
jgi:hypothetical protein